MLVAKPGKKLSVLVVDDDEPIREILVSFFEYMEIFTHIIEACDGSEAFNKFKNQEFDIVITDVMMPKTDGLKFIKNIKDSEKMSGLSPCSIVVLSGQLTDKEVSTAVGYGVKHVLAKPFKSQIFVKKIKDILLKECRDKILVKPKAESA